MGRDRWPGIPSLLLDGDKGGSWGRSAPGMWTCVADLGAALAFT